MGKTATVFKDIGKACSDLLSKDFKTGKTTVELKSETPSGVTFTPTATKAGDSVSGKLAAKYNFLPWLESELTFGTSGSIEATIEAADALTAGLTLTAECEHAPGKAGLLQAGNLIAEYKQEAFACKTSYDYYKGDLLCSASTMFGDIAAGVDAAYSASKGALVKYALAGQMVKPDFTVAAKYADSKGAGTLSCSYFHKVSSLMQVGVNVAKPLAKPDVGIEFGCAYKLDKDTTVKAKVESAGTLSCSYKQKVSAITTMTLAAQVDAVNLDKQKFGLEMMIAP